MKPALLLSLLLLPTLRLFAHDTWLQSTTPSVLPGEAVVLQLTSGNGFKGVESGPQPDRVIKSHLRIAGRTLSLTTGERTEKFLTFTGKPTAPGIAGFAVELKPRDLELKPELIEEYFEEIHAEASLRAEWEKVPAPRRWRERYIKSATTFVRVGDPATDDRTWAQPAGLSLEIVPQRDPTRLKAGDLLKVQLLMHGKPLPGLPLGFVADGESHHHVVTTDSNGFAAAPMDHPGRWLVHGTYLTRSAEKNLEWESVFSTLVVDVAAAP